MPATNFENDFQKEQKLYQNSEHQKSEDLKIYDFSSSNEDMGLDFELKNNYVILPDEYELNEAVWRNTIEQCLEQCFIERDMRKISQNNLIEKSRWNYGWTIFSTISMVIAFVTSILTYLYSDILMRCCPSVAFTAGQHFLDRVGKICDKITETVYETTREQNLTLDLVSTAMDITIVLYTLIFFGLYAYPLHVH